MRNHGTALALGMALLATFSARLASGGEQQAADAMHPSGILAKHPMQKMKCADCHALEWGVRKGLAKVKDESERAALTAECRQAACGKCHQGDEVPDASLLSQGRRLAKELGCAGCHRIKGFPSTAGVDISQSGGKDFNRDRRVDLRDREWVFEHFKSPSSRRANSWMAEFGLTDEEASALTTLVFSLRKWKVSPDLVVPAPPEPEPASVIERGKRLWERWGCAGCHGRAGKGKIKNPNAKGNESPQLYKYADTLVNTEEEANRLLALIQKGASLDDPQDEWLEEVRKMKKLMHDGRAPQKEDPNGPPPPLAMPSFKGQIEGKDLDALLAYIVSLFPKEEWKEWDEEEGEKKSEKSETVR